MILIGSRALALRAPGILRRECVDFDFVADEDTACTWLWDHEREYDREGNKLISASPVPPIEFDLITPGSSNEMLESLVGYNVVTQFGRIPDLNTLFTIKSSHKYKKDSPFFWKTLSDYHRMKAAGAVIPEHLKEFHRVRETESYAAQKHPKLNVDKANFFVGDGVTYHYDHDQVHNAIKLLDKPAYQYYMKDGSEVMSDKTKFFDAKPEVRLYGVIEEACTLAIERSLVPFPGVLTPLQAWRFAFSKVCTSITSGWFRAFAYDSAPEILRVGPGDYWERFQAAGLKRIS